MSEYAAFAYTTALNDLLADSNHVKYFGDMTVVYWAKGNRENCVARLSIRFFMRKTFGAVIKNLAKHYSNLNIIKPSSEKFENIPLWQILAATVPPNSKEKSALPLMSGAVVQAVMTRQNYPASLFQNVLLRIKADNNVTYE